MSNQRAERLEGEAPEQAARDPAAQFPGAAILGADVEGILAGISDGLVALDNEWRVIYVNPAVQRMWGRDVRGLLGRTIHEALQVAEDNPFRIAYANSKLRNEPLAFSGYSNI